MAFRVTRPMKASLSSTTGTKFWVTARSTRSRMEVAVDGDVFEPSNLNRQLLSQVPLLGVSKAKAVAEHIARVNPDVLVEAAECYLTEDNAAELLAGCDVVMDALDNIPSRKILAAACAEAKIPYIYGAIQGWVAQAAISMPGDHLIDRLYPEEIEIRDKSVLSFTPALCAAMLSIVLWAVAAWRFGLPTDTQEQRRRIREKYMPQ